MKKYFFQPLFFIVLIGFSQNTFGQVYGITTVAGMNNFFGGDGGLATSAELYSPSGIAVDAAGNIYIADYYNDAIRKVNTSGIISTIAGNGTFGFSGDGGLATMAQLDKPTGVALDASGNIYIADEGNNRVREVNTSGIISTIAGNGTSAYSGDGGPATAAELQYPTGVAVDASGNVYIADYFNERIRKINTSGIISTVAGNGTGGFSGDGGAATSAELFSPTGIAVDASGDLFIADLDNNCIREVNSTGIISTIAGNGASGYSGDGGAATSAELSTPTSVIVDASGNVYLVDGGNNVIRKINTSGIISTIAGDGISGYSGDGGAATSAKLNSPWGIAFNAAGDLFIGDQNNNAVREVNTSGIISTFAGNGIQGFSGDGGIATSAELNSPYAVAIDASGKLDIADLFNNRVRQVNASDIISTIAGNGTGNFSGDGAASTAAELNQPYGVAVDIVGNIYIADAENNRVRVINTSGIISTFAGDSVGGYGGDGGAAVSAELQYPTGVALDHLGNLYIADQNNNIIRKVNPSGIISTVAGNGIVGYLGDGGAATSAELAYPVSIAVDTANNIYIADNQNSRIRKINSLGIISTVAGNGTQGYAGDGTAATAAELHSPTGVAVDVAGNIYIADENNNCIRKVVLTSGIISTIAGNGTSGFSGDGGNATLAELNGPSGLALDASGNVYVADENNNRVRELTAPTGIAENNFSNDAITIYPNPTNGIFSVFQKNNFQNLNLEIYNVLGEKIFFSTLTANNTSFDLSNNAAGVYLYKIFSADGKYNAIGKIILR